MGVAHTRVTLLGKVAGGAENWSSSFSTAPMIGASYSDLLAACDVASLAFVTAATTWGLETHWTAATSFIGCKVSAIDAAGHTTLSAESLLGDPLVGEALGATLPPEVAIVCSLRTTIPGPRGRGRMYLPPSRTADCNTVGGVDPDYQSIVLAVMQKFLNDWNADPDTLRASVASNAGGFVTAVDSVRVGNVWDSQRRRRDSIPESYLSGGITP